MEQDLLVKAREQEEVLEEVAAEVAWVETVQDQDPEVIAFVRVADIEFLINVESRVIRQSVRNVGQRW